jgi:flagellar basal body-associated protein FliL
MSRNAIDPESAAVKIKLVHLVWAACILSGSLITWTAWSVDKLNSIETRIAALQSAQPSYWTTQDQERIGNWLRQDNPGLKVRDVRDSLIARTP